MEEQRNNPSICHFAFSISWSRSLTSGPYILLQRILALLVRFQEDFHLIIIDVPKIRQTNFCRSISNLAAIQCGSQRDRIL